MRKTTRDELLRELEALRRENAQLQAEVQGHREIEDELRLRTDEALHRVLTGAWCLLWHAEVAEKGDGKLDWNVSVVDEVAAQHFFPLDIGPDQTYIEAWYFSRPPEDRERNNTFGYAQIRAGKNYGQEFQCRQRDGAIRWLWEQVHVETLGPGRWRVVGVCTDITDRKRLEQQFLQAQKMEGVGRLAGGIAHDFNNLLTAILGYTELACEELAEGHTARASLQNVLKAGERAAALTAQLLAFARKQVIEPRVIRLNDLLLETDKLLRRLIGEDVELVTLPRPEVGHVRVDPGQFGQVLINLAVNARDAMPTGGKLTIETQNVTLDADYAAQHPEVTPGAYVMVAISDTGTGMDEETQKHIFDPFFTTKPQGQGTGLGLATTYGIVKQSGGHIWVYSEPGHGTTFKIYLPGVDAQEVGAAAGSSETRAPEGTETILLVEDEALVRDLAVRALKAHGYTVIEAANGHEALRAAGHSQPIHLLVTDVVMPQMGGRELAHSLQASYPGLKVLYTSGYTDDVVVRHAVIEAEQAFLQKPFTLTTLINKVREILG